MDKFICINTFSGRNIYIRSSEDKWQELTKGVEVFAGYMVTGWRLDQDKIEKIITGADPDCEVVAIRPKREYHEQLGAPCPPRPPVPDYYITYSSVDKPEA
jgi:hypothetical protein